MNLDNFGFLALGFRVQIKLCPFWCKFGQVLDCNAGLWSRTLACFVFEGLPICLYVHNNFAQLCDWLYGLGDILLTLLLSSFTFL